MNIDIGFLFLVLLSLTGLILSIRYTKVQDKEQSEVVSGAGIFGNFVNLLITLLPFKVRKAIYIIVCLLMVLLFSIGLWSVSKV
ncbi:UNVERIFIED_ORG: putative permease [Peribacillus simplex]